METIVLGGGCFWCTEAVFKMINGVISVTSGYAGGKKEDLTYEEISETGHIETVKVEFNPNIVSLSEILSVFFASHNPTSLDRQEEDVGHQYRSVIFFNDDTQKKEAEKIISEINTSFPEGKPFVTEIKPLEKFYKAEKYHDNYYEKHREAPYCRLVIDPKLEKIKKKFRTLLKNK